MPLTDGGGEVSTIEIMGNPNHVAQLGRLGSVVVPVLLLVGKMNIAKLTGALTSIEGVLTGWLPGYLLLSGVLGPAATAAKAAAGH